MRQRPEPGPANAGRLTGMLLLVGIAVVLTVVIGLALHTGLTRPPMTPQQIADWERQKAEAALGNPSAGGREYEGW